MTKLVHFLFIICICFTYQTYSYENVEDGFDLLSNSKAHRVDEDVKRPVRFCQGFEDPAEIDCYIRSDIKPYVCTEPVSFNPCESRQRVETFHYDHITHKCYKVNVPACEGQIIRVMTLIQCLIYCHTKDPFALGKSRSMVFKLNQEKPYVPHEKLENEKDRILKIRDGDEKLSKDLLSENEVKQNSTVLQESRTITKTPETSVGVSNMAIPTESPNTGKEVKDSQSMDIENLNEDSFIKALNDDDELADYLVNGNSELAGKYLTPRTTVKCENCATTAKKAVKSSESVSKNHKKQSENIEHERKTSSFIDENKSESIKEHEKVNIKNLNEVKRFIVENNEKEQVDISEEQKKSKKTENNHSPENRKTVKEEIDKRNIRVQNMKSDSTDKSRDDGFYLWDE